MNITIITINIWINNIKFLTNGSFDTMESGNSAIVSEVSRIVGDDRS